MQQSCLNGILEIRALTLSELSVVEEGLDLTVEMGKGRRYLHRAMVVTLALLALVTPVCRSLSRVDWRLDLVAQFQLPGLILTIIAVFALVRTTKWTRRYMTPWFVVLGLCQSWGLLQYSWPLKALPTATDGVPLKILYANVDYHVLDYQPFLSLVKSEDPDIVAIVEFNARCQAVLHELPDSYPYRIEIADGTDGIALYSKLPVLADPPSQLIRPLRGKGNPALCSTIDLSARDPRQRPLHLWILHGPNLLFGGGPQSRQEFESLARLIRERFGPTLVVGDFNRTEGSLIFHDFLETTGLRDGRYGHGRQPSWPTWSPIRLAIDHTLISEEWVVLDRRLGPHTPSDHFPVLLELSPAKSFPSTSEN